MLNSCCWMLLLATTLPSLMTRKPQSPRLMADSLPPSCIMSTHAVALPGSRVLRWAYSSTSLGWFPVAGGPAMMAQSSMRVEAYAPGSMPSSPHPPTPSATPKAPSQASSSDRSPEEAKKASSPPFSTFAGCGIACPAHFTSTTSAPAGRFSAVGSWGGGGAWAAATVSVVALPSAAGEVPACWGAGRAGASAGAAAEAAAGGDGALG
mmetsp:Transcript_11129/g.31534  ORF Transcript_11129/g.31534 Transcript_11129/m.31534 type:complete len:208 (+) Transcript_11129:713-1336(+)